MLDVGAFCGETAVYFARQGAKRVIVYEPVKEHHELIRQNIAINGFTAELHEEGLGDKTGEVSINYDETDLGFGLTNNVKNTRIIVVKSAAELIRKSKSGNSQNRL